MRMIIATVGWILVVTAGRLAAQNDEREVLAAVQQLFDGMRAQDTARMRAVLHPEARLLSAGVREGIPVVTVVSPGRWRPLPQRPGSEAWPRNPAW